MNRSIETEIIAGRLLSNDMDRLENSVNMQGVSESARDDFALLNDMHLNIQTLETLRNNIAYRTVDKEKGPRNYIKFLIKRVIRKAIRWYLESICTQQTEFNNAVLHIARDTFLFTRKQTVFMDQLKEDLNKATQNMQPLLMAAGAQEEALQAIAKRVGKIEACLGACLPTETEAPTGETPETAQAPYVCLAEVLKRQSDAVASLQGGVKKLQDMGIADALKTQGAVIENCRKQLSGVEEQFTRCLDVKSRLYEAQESLSQCGEDIIVGVILASLGVAIPDATYLDLGANHAQKYSNTYTLYRQGAHGVLVEANPALIPELIASREKDVVLHRCIADASGETRKFYVFTGYADGLSTMNAELAEKIAQANPQFTLQPPIDVETVAVNELMEQYFPNGLSMMNLDIEGAEMPILRSIDFDQYRPLLIVVEMIAYKPTLVVGEKNEEILRFLENKEYVEFAFTGINSIFIDRRRIGGLEH